MKCAFLDELNRLHVGVLAFLEGKYPDHAQHWLVEVVGEQLLYRMRCSCGAELELTLRELLELSQATMH